VKLNHANQITVVRILLIIPFVICMLKINSADTGNTMRYIAIVIFMVMAGSDAYDGYIARKNNEVTRLGSFLDPMADKLLMTCACLLLAIDATAVTGFKLPSAVVVLIIGKDIFLLLGFVILYFLTFQVKIMPVKIGKLATFLQLSMVAGILIAPEVSQIFGWWIWFLRLLWYSAALTAIITTLVYILAGSRYIEDFENANPEIREVK